MTPEEREHHTAMQEKMKLLVAIVAELDLDPYIERMKRAHEFVVFADPTLFIEKGKDLQVEISIASAARYFKRVIEIEKKEIQRQAEVRERGLRRAP
jgi:hypothetical protein